jgi:hypothetical protein
MGIRTGSFISGIGMADLEGGAVVDGEEGTVVGEEGNVVGEEDDGEAIGEEELFAEGGEDELFVEGDGDGDSVAGDVDGDVVFLGSVVGAVVLGHGPSFAPAFKWPSTAFTSTWMVSPLAEHMVSLDALVGVAAGCLAGEADAGGEESLADAGGEESRADAGDEESRAGPCWDLEAP